MDEMARAHAKDMEKDGRYRRLADELKVVCEEMHGRRAAHPISDAIDALDEERAAIVRRWD